MSRFLRWLAVWAEDLVPLAFLVVLLLAVLVMVATAAGLLSWRAIG